MRTLCYICKTLINSLYTISKPVDTYRYHILCIYYHSGYAMFQSLMNQHKRIKIDKYFYYLNFYTATITFNYNVVPITNYIFGGNNLLIPNLVILYNLNIYISRRLLDCPVVAQCRCSKLEHRRWVP